jgi:hypothetical protein
MLHNSQSQESLVSPQSFLLNEQRTKKDQHHFRSLSRTLALMQVLTLWQCGGLFHCLPKSSESIHRSHYSQPALRTLELAVDKISILSTSLAHPGKTPLTVS